MIVDNDRIVLKPSEPLSAKVKKVRFAGIEEIIFCNNDVESPLNKTDELIESLEEENKTKKLSRKTSIEVKVIESAVIPA